jgi:signal transduction histidine kinase
MKTLTKREHKLSTSDNALVSAFHLETPDAVSDVPCRSALIDADGRIVAVSKDWMALAKKTAAALKSIGPGANYLEICREASDACPDADTALRGIRAVMGNRASSFTMDYLCNTPQGPCYFRMAATAIVYGEARFAISHTKVAGRQRSEEQTFRVQQQFAQRLINAQEEERQRIAHEIHDDLGNRIALMALSLRQVMKQSSANSACGTGELQNVLEQMMGFSFALRDLSHGLHPPLLQHAGIKVALKMLRETFARTHPIRIDLVVAAELPRLTDDVALCIFRIVQESLQNVAKQSRARNVSVVLEHTASEVLLTVSDTGRGFIRSESIQKAGLGLLSMEARARCVGGVLTVNSRPGAGTVIRLSIPLRQAVSVITP